MSALRNIVAHIRAAVLRWLDADSVIEREMRDRAWKAQHNQEST